MIPSWREALAEEVEAPYFKKLQAEIKTMRGAGKVIYPEQADVFNALKLTPLPNVKAVILGQDPYHGIGQAHGLCFSVKAGVKPPPSLINIFKELKSDLNIKQPDHGYLTKWAEQGVLMLNAILTVEQNKPASHHNMGWERFTDAVIQRLNTLQKNVVFILWGSYAQKKVTLIDTDKHLILKAAHPSPFSAHNGFFGCKHFSQCNNYLLKYNRAAIDWSLAN